MSYYTTTQRDILQSTKELITSTGLKFTIDPLGYFEGIKPLKLMEAMGILPHFAAEVHLMAPESVQEAFNALMEVYGMGFGDGSSEATLTPEGVYQYPEDPDMSPMVTFHITDKIDWHVYQYSLTAVTDGTTSLFARFD